MIFADDPEHHKKDEDSQLAWSLKMFLESKDPGDMLIFPMAKASLQIMKAVNEFAEAEQLIEAGSGHVVMGASKRGWATWMIGAANSPNFPPILGIIPLVPIVPALQ